MTLGQEFGAYAMMIDSAIRAIERAAYEFLDINMGATAIGTGINSPPGYANLVTQKLAEVSGFELRRAKNLVEATQNAGTFVQMSATLKMAGCLLDPVVASMKSIFLRCNLAHRSCRERSTLLFLNS
jgi:aspartate ammonia-lyase